MDSLYLGRAVGVIPPGEQVMDTKRYRTWAEVCAVGVWGGIKPGWLGLDLTLTHFSGPGSSTRRSPWNIGFVYILPDVFQLHADKMWDDEGDQRCGMCAYLFKELGEDAAGVYRHEEPCDCHFLCAACCTGERARAATREGAAV